MSNNLPAPQPTSPPQPKVIVAIPCYNEERFIGEVVRKAKKYVDQVIVIDDGSSDNTGQVAEAAGALVVKHEKRAGAGAATKTGFNIAQESHADALVTIDGDGQHDPDELPQVIAPILNGEADLVIGSRFIQNSLNQSQSSPLTTMPRYRKFGINVITWLFNIGSKVKISDAQSCFRTHSGRLLHAVNITENGFGFSVQVLIQAREEGFQIKEVPISCSYHPGSSTINPVSHGVGVAFTVVKFRLKNLLRSLIRGE